jgi:hypothetical protein
MAHLAEKGDGFNGGNKDEYAGTADGDDTKKLEA